MDKKKLFQTGVYFLGLLLILVFFIQFFYGGFLNDQISIYEKRAENAKMVRSDLVTVEFDYMQVDIDYVALDFDSYASTTNGYFNITEAIIRLMAQAQHYSKVYGNFETFFLNHYNDPDKDVQWIFTEKIIALSWLAEDFTSIKTTFEDTYDIDNFDEWITIAYTASFDFFNFAGSRSILVDWLGNVPFMISVDYFLFDEYVLENYTKPLANAEDQLDELNAMVAVTTIGLLILGFIVDYESVFGAWKVIFLILAFIAVIFAFQSIGTFLGGGS